MVSGLIFLPKVSAKSNDLQLITANDNKAAADKIVNYPAEYLGLASSILIDNQDSSNSCTVRLNNNFNTITIASSSFRAFNDSWIEQVEVTGSSTNVQITAQVAPLESIR